MQKLFIILKAADREKARIHEAELKGRAEGRTEGRAEGRTEGEAKAHQESAKVLKSLGTPYDVITKATGLTKEEIDSL
jgi:predicted transposase/invertase (TIGR01784 family)